MVDPERGETVCGGCGTVLESTEMVPHFNGNHSVFGDRVTRTDIPGNPRMQRLNRQCGTDSTAVNARFSVMACCKKLGLPSFVETRAVALFTKLRTAIKGKKGINDMVAAAVYMACRECSITRSLDEICDAMGSKKRRAWCHYRIMHEVVRPALPPPTPKGFITRLASNLGLSVKVSKKALDVWESMRGDKAVGGRSPATLAAYATYVAALECGEGVELGAVANAAGISRSGLANTTAFFKNPDAYYWDSTAKRYKLVQNPHDLSSSLTKKLLEKLYVEDGMTIRQICKELCHTNVTISKYLRLHGIPIRQRGTDVVITKKLLEKLYVEDGMTQKQISAKLGCSYSMVHRHRALHGIPSRRPDLGDSLTKEILERLHVKDRMTARQISVKLGCSYKTVYRHLALHGIRVRPKNAAPGVRVEPTQKIRLPGIPRAPKPGLTGSAPVLRDYKHQQSQRYGIWQEW